MSHNSNGCIKANHGQGQSQTFAKMMNIQVTWNCMQLGFLENTSEVGWYDKIQILDFGLTH